MYTSRVCRPVFLLLLIVAIGWGAIATAAPVQQGPKGAQGKCGDAICDPVERKRPELCPQDCPPPQNIAPVGSTPAAQNEWSGGTGTQENTPQEGSEPVTVVQDGGDAKPSQQANIAFILDASGSMAAPLAVGKTKLDVAKEVLPALIADVAPEVNGALWIYGHRLPDEPKEESCQDIERVFALSAIDANAYAQAITRIAARGYTPIADTLVSAARDLPADPGQSNSIVLISDGQETCGGDPCTVAAALKESGADVTIHVIGYDVDEETRQQLECIARASGGTYRDAANADLLKEAVSGALEASQAETVLRVEVLGPEETQVSSLLHLIDPASGNWVTQVGSWRDSSVPPGVYDAVIDTHPQLDYTEFRLPEGSTTTVHLNVASLDIRGEDGQREHPYQVVLVDPTNGEILATMFDPGDQPYYVMPGVYDVELYPSVSQSSPEAVYHNVEFKPLHSVTLGIGSLALLDLEGNSIAPQEIGFLDPSSGEELFGFYGYSPEKYNVAPGTYRVELYWGISADPRGILDNLMIAPGQTTTIALGAYTLSDAEGNPINPDHEVIDEPTGEIVGTYGGYSPDRYYFPPGTYTIQSRWGDDFRVEHVTIEPGRETAVKLNY